jgi:hypothetical protein
MDNIVEFLPHLFRAQGAEPTEPDEALRGFSYYCRINDIKDENSTKNYDDLLVESKLRKNAGSPYGSLGLATYHLMHGNASGRQHLRDAFAIPDPTIYNDLLALALDACAHVDLEEELEDLIAKVVEHLPTHDDSIELARYAAIKLGRDPTSIDAMIAWRR